MSTESAELADTADDVQEPDTGAEATDTEAEVDWKAEAEKWKSLARKHDERAKNNHKAAEELKAMQDAGKSELEIAQQRAEQAEARLAELETTERQTRIAAKHGISELAHRLNGDEEEMTAFAKELAKFKAASTASEDKPSFDGGPRNPAPAGRDMNDLLRQAAGRV